MSATPLILVCDDAGFESVDRGIRTLVEHTGQPVSAEYMIEQEGAAERARAIAEIGLVSRGLHFELMNISDADRFRLGKELLAGGQFLGELAQIQQRGTADARKQLRMFQDTQGINPAHISTHGNFNTDAHGRVLPWWKDLMEEMFDGQVPPMQLDIPHVRHNLYSWNVPPTERPPRNEEEFSDQLALADLKGHAAEFVMHPALVRPGDADLQMLFTAEMRQRDLWSAIRLINSGVIERAGFAIVPVDTLHTSDAQLEKAA